MELYRRLDEDQRATVLQHLDALTDEEAEMCMVTARHMLHLDKDSSFLCLVSHIGGFMAGLGVFRGNEDKVKKLVRQCKILWSQCENDGFSSEDPLFHLVKNVNDAVTDVEEKK